MDVTSNLYAALGSLQAYETGYWWIDALCINQLSNPKEKNKQVEMMHEIYKSAESVLVWLGDMEPAIKYALHLCGWLNEAVEQPEFPSEECTETWDALHAHSQPVTSNEPVSVLTATEMYGLANALRLNEDVRLTSGAFDQLDLPSFSSPTWRSFSDLFANQWLSRIWTFQEVMLARRASVRSGPVAISWSAFFNIGMRLSHTQLLFHPDVLRQEGDQRRLTRLRLFMNEPGQGEHFWLYVSEGRHRDVSEPVDRIYGVLSLASDEIRREIPVDYGTKAVENYRNVWKHATKVMMDHFGAGHILQLVDTSQIDTSLPSWCPHYDLVSKANGAMWCSGRAGFFSPSTTQIFLADESDEVQIGGFIIDKVKLVLNEFDWRLHSDDAHKLTEWLDAIESILRPCSANEGQLALWLAQCLLNYIPGAPDGSRMVGPTFPTKPAQSFQAIRLRWKELSEGIEARDSALNDSDWDLLQAVKAHMSRIWLDRVFFLTDRGYFGIAFRGIRLGDDLCLPVASAHFCVLRPQSDERTFVSMAYVHGHMLGEMLRNHTEGTHQMLRIR